MLAFPIWHFLKTMWQVTSLPRIFQQLIPTPCRIRLQGSLLSGLSPHSATLPNWHLQVFITSLGTLPATPLHSSPGILLSPPANLLVSPFPVQAHAPHTSSESCTYTIGSSRCELGGLHCWCRAHLGLQFSWDNEWWLVRHRHVSCKLPQSSLAGDSLRSGEQVISKNLYGRK